MTRPAGCWIDGRFLEAPSVPAADRGLLYGEAVFETLLVANGRPFRLDAHLARMQASVAALGLPSPAGEWTRAVEKALGVLARRLGGVRGRARLTLTAGDAEADGDPAAPPPGPGRLILTVSPYSGLPGHLMRAGAAAALAGPVAGGQDLALARHKTVAYLPHLRTLRAARAAGYDEGLRCDHRGRLLGGSRSNLFLVRNGRLLTPGREGGCLPGITRAIVLDEVAPDLEVPIEEIELERADLERADEAFLTNSLWGVLPLARLGARTLPSAAPGSVSRALASGYQSALERECASHGSQ